MPTFETAQTVADEASPPAVASPFLDGIKIQYALDSTSIELVKRCPRLYYYTMIQGWEPQDESIHLRFGIEYHQALHDYDTCRSQGTSHDDAVFDVVRQLILRSDQWPEHKYKNRNNLLRTVIWYLEKYRNDPARTLILENGKPAVEVSFRFELDWKCMGERPYLLCGHLDRIVVFSGEMFVMDRKTTSSTLSEYYFNQFEPNNQMSCYTLAGQVALKSPIKGVIVDCAEIKVDFSRFSRFPTYRTPDQTHEWLEGLRYWTKRLEEWAVEDDWPMNDTACDKYGGCRFREICSKSPHIREAFLKSNFQKKAEPWNPLKPR